MIASERMGAILTKERVMVVALSMWFCSLWMNAVHHQHGTEKGWQVMKHGFSMFLLPHPYTNILFFIALFLLWENKITAALCCSACVFLIGLSSFSFDEILYQWAEREEGGYRYELHTTQVYAWEWGAILWISAYALVFLLCFRKKFEEISGLINTLIISIPILWGVIFTIGSIQYRLANIYEKEHYFTSQTAFVVKPLILFPYVPFGDLKFDDKTLIAFSGGINNNQNELVYNHFSIPLPEKYIYNNKLFYDITNPINLLIIRDLYEDEKEDYEVAFYDRNNEIGVKIMDAKSQQITWKAPLKVTQTRFGTWRQQPNYIFHNLYPRHQYPLLFIEGQFNDKIFQRVNFAKVTGKSHDLYNIYSSPKAIKFYHSEHPSSKLLYIYQHKEHFIFIRQYGESLYFTLVDTLESIYYQDIIINNEKHIDFERPEWKKFRLQILVGRDILIENNIDEVILAKTYEPSKTIHH